jgi:uncharacterized membrane protein
MNRYLIGLLICLAVLVTLNTLVSKIHRLTADLSTERATVSTLQKANQQQASAIKQAAEREKGLRQLLDRQAAEQAALDQHNRNIADELQRALATPPAGRPDCAREPLPAGALRLLGPASDRDSNRSRDTPAASGGSAKLPGT